MASLKNIVNNEVRIVAHKYFGNLLEDKRVLITGSNRGLGLLMARRFLECGANVIICGAPDEDVTEAVNRLKDLDPSFEVMGCKPDLTNEVDLEKLMNIIESGWGGLDVLINNAGIYPFRTFEEYPQELLRQVFEVNVFGMFTMSQKAVQIMKKNPNGGVILNTSSMAGIDGAMANIGYTASKFAVQGLTLGLARELGKYHIRVNGVAPAGILRTDLSGHVIEQPSLIKMVGSQASTEEMMAIERVANCFAPLGDYRCHPDEIINAFIYLASDASNFVSGQTIVIDGACIWPAANPLSCL